MHEQQSAIDQRPLTVGTAMGKRGAQISGRAGGVESSDSDQPNTPPIPHIVCFGDRSGIRFQGIVFDLSYKSRCGMTSVSPGWTASARSMPCWVFFLSPRESP